MPTAAELLAAHRAFATARAMSDLYEEHARLTSKYVHATSRGHEAIQFAAGRLLREQDFLTFDAMRQTAQCVGRVIRSKRDYGVLIFADARYGASDKRSKLPSWVRQFLPDSHLALSTDAAVHTARAFLKSLAQPRPREWKSTPLRHPLQAPPSSRPP